MKNNKLNKEDYSSNVTISENGLVATNHSCLNYSLLFLNIFNNYFLERDCVRSNLPIPIFNLKGINKQTISFYFEMQILTCERYFLRIK